VKRKLMMQSGKEQKEFTGVFDCFKKVYQTGGLVSFWRGYSSNIFRSIGSSLCLVLYDWIKKERKAII
jgi:solute carrier family 25 (adenine nucleotide translocator) protein 4/5/6/31